MTTEIKTVSKETFEVIVSATNKMVDFIRPTLGPASNKVIIKKNQWQMPVDDGVQIARDFELPDPMENAVVALIREIAIKTNDRVGDGTTGSMVIFQAIINEVARLSRWDGREVEAELRKGLKEVISTLQKSKREIKTKEELKKVAMIAFDNEEIAEMVADLYMKVGKDGVITIDKSPGLDTYVELSDGLKLETGYVSAFMANNRERMECVFENAHILFTDYRLTEGSDIVPLMNKMIEAGKKNLVIIAENVEQNALATLLKNEPHIMNPETGKVGVFASVAISLPQVHGREELLEDLAMMTGGKVFSVTKGDKIEDANIDDLGTAKKFICKREESVIVEPGGDKKVVARAIYDLKSNLVDETNKQKKDELLHRIGRYTNSVAVLRVGAPTDNEQQALKYKVEDCVNSVRVAYRSGVVCGAGLALAKIETSSPILNEALKYPARQLWDNMGLQLDMSEHDGDKATNIVTGETGDYFEVGVVDPVKVLEAGVESAISIASILLTSSGILVEVDKEEK